MKKNILYPTTVSFETSNICNCKCIICPLFHGDKQMDLKVRKPMFMDMELFDRLIDQVLSFPTLPFIYLNMFGEPLLDKTLPQKLAKIKEAGLAGRVYLQTNAEHLTEAMSEHILRAEIFRIVPCLESADKARAEMIRPGIVFEHVRDNIIRFAALRDKLGVQTSIAIQHVRTRLNFDDYKDVFALLKDHLHHKEDRINVIKSHSWASSDLAKQEYILSRASNSLRHGECSQLSTFLIVLADGKISPCCFDYNLELGDFGDAHTSDLLTIWNSEPFVQLRKRIHFGGGGLPHLCTQCISLCSTQTMDDVMIPGVRQYHSSDNTTLFFNKQSESFHESP